MADRVGADAVDLPVGRRLCEVARGAGAAAECLVARVHVGGLADGISLILLELNGLFGGYAVGLAQAKQIRVAGSLGVVLISRPDHDAAEAELVCSVNLQLHGLAVVVADPRVGIPGDPFDRSRRVKRGLCPGLRKNIKDLRVGERAGRVGAWPGVAAGAELADAIGRAARGIRQSEAAAVPAKAQRRIAWIDAIARQHVEAELDLREVCVRQDVRAGELVS